MLGAVTLSRESATIRMLLRVSEMVDARGAYAILQSIRARCPMWRTLAARQTPATLPTRS